MIDLVLRGGRVIDGTGSPWIRGDVGITGDRITLVAPHIDFPTVEVVDVPDLCVAPGFIDMHVHADLQIIADSGWQCEVMQGVTTLVIGQDGLGLAPVSDATIPILKQQLKAWNGDPALDWGWRSMDDYLNYIKANGTSPNVATLVGHGTVRLLHMGQDARRPTTEEMGAMVATVKRSMEEGALGLSTGLTYAPGMSATDDELVTLCRSIREFGGFYQPHHRDYGKQALQGYADSIAIGRDAGVPVQLTHAAMNFAPNKGRAGELLAQVDQARSLGLDVTLDSYPYLAGSTYMHAFLPSWAHAGGTAELLVRLRDPEQRSRMQHALEVDGTDGLGGVTVDWSTLVVSQAAQPENAHLIGLSITQAAEVLPRSRSPFDVYCDLILSEDAGAGCLLFCGDEENVRAIVGHPAHMACSDGLVMGNRPHPRGWGTFARYLATYVREEPVLGLEEMVRHMTSAPANRLGLTNRGLIRPGMAADIVVFDAATVKDLATYESPKRAPTGIPHVLINGQFAKRDGKYVDIRPGRVLRRGV